MTITALAPARTRRDSQQATLAAAYERCRGMSRRHGTTYHWASYGLPKVKRHHVWALYGFCRLADDIVDDPRLVDDVASREAALVELRRQLFHDWRCGGSTHPVLHAVVHTARAFELPMEYFERFLDSMAMDLRIDSYETFADLLTYMDGSAAVIGEMMLPILEPGSADAFEPARDLGLAFQLTNFLRDVGEDLDRHRVYLPLEDIERFCVAVHSRTVDDRWRALMEYEFDRCAALYESADVGIDMLPPAEARCIRTARQLYAGIIDRIRARDYDVFSDRAYVPVARKLLAAATIVVRARP